MIAALRKDHADRWPTMAASRSALRDGLGAARRRRRSGVPAPRAATPPIALGDEVRIASVLLGEGVDADGVRGGRGQAEGGHASPLPATRGRRLRGEPWRGDEAERAVRAALPSARTGAEHAARGGHRAAACARAGEVTGAAVAAPGVLGDEAWAPTQETLRRIRGGFERGRRTRAPRGRGRARSSASEGPGGAGLAARGTRDRSSRICGRLRTVVGGSGAMGLLVPGPTGIGKSRLLPRATARRAEDTDRAPTWCSEPAAERRTHLRGLAHARQRAAPVRCELPEGTPPEAAHERLLALCPTRTVAEFFGSSASGYPGDPTLRTARADPGVMRDQMTGGRRPGSRP